MKDIETQKDQDLPLRLNYRHGNYSILTAFRDTLTLSYFSIFIWSILNELVTSTPIIYNT